MAKTKTIKAAPKNRNDDNTDFTIRNPLNAIIKFNTRCVLDIELNTEQMSVSVIMTDPLTGYKFNGVAHLED